MQRNRESAMQSRQRRKMQLEELERRNAELQTQNTHLTGRFPLLLHVDSLSVLGPFSCLFTVFLACFMLHGDDWRQLHVQGWWLGCRQRMLLCAISWPLSRETARHLLACLHNQGLFLHLPGCQSHTCHGCLGCPTSAQHPRCLFTVPLRHFKESIGACPCCCVQREVVVEHSADSVLHLFDRLRSKGCPSRGLNQPVARVHEQRRQTQRSAPVSLLEAQRYWRSVVSSSSWGQCPSGLMAALRLHSGARCVFQLETFMF